MEMIERFFRAWAMAGVMLSGHVTGGTTSHAAETFPQQVVPHFAAPIRIDARLEEPCYRSHPPLTNFVVAGEAAAASQSTKAWLFWRPNGLVFAFEVSDTNIVAAPPTTREHDVDQQDRVEVFLWSGKTNDTYYCLEVGALGAVHDYAARFYRQFDDTWKPAGMKIAVRRTALGYTVEGLLPRTALEAAGFKLQAGERWRCGLFRADFRPGHPDDPQWICWVDARGPKPDFHVARSFGEIVLAGQPKHSSK